MTTATMQRPAAARHATAELPAHIQPCDGRVLVRPAAAGKVTHGGILLPDNCKRPFGEIVRGTVLAVGPCAWSEDGLRRLPMPVQTDDVILYGKDMGADVEWGGETLKILTASEVLARVVVDKEG